ncbi:MAG: S8 family serine peptidase [Proteobacteria bacterium]|nr:S8 family serine peptidase [Pseudomonadota bacterium]
MGERIGVLVIRRAFSAAALLFVVLSASALHANPKIDPYLDSSSADPDFKALSISAPLPKPADDPPVEVFVKASDVGAAADLISSLGGSVRVTSGSVITASIQASGLEDLAGSEDVVFIEAAKPVGLSSDLAGAEIGLPEVSAGMGLPAGYTGEGIVIGIVDTGVDYSHPDFLDSEGRSRVLAIWDQGRSGGPPPAEIANSYGSECEHEKISSGTCALTDADGHGTHVAGIAAGRHGQYRGVAPDANIVVVKYDAKLDLESGYADTLFSTKICEAAYYVFAKAAKYGVPAVVNMSLGTHLGAHDGTSLFEQCLAGLAQGQAGRALVAAAGNEHNSDRSYTGIHAGFDPAGRELASNFVIRQKTGDRLYYIDLWGAKGSDIAVGLAIHNGTPSRDPAQRSYMARPGDKISGSFYSGKIKYLINATEKSSPLNGKPHVGIRIQLSTEVENPLAYSFDLVVKGTGGFDAWLFPDKPARTMEFTAIEGNKGGAYDYVPGDRIKSIAIPATSPEVIAVAAYATRTRWEADSLTWVFNGQELGDILNFSSSGPTADPAFTGQKPELAAPGGMVASALSASAGVSSQVITADGKHYMQAGTSMAAPFVSGAVALMFQHNPNFTQTDVEAFLTQGAYADSFTGGVPNDRWGAGKLDLLKSMELAVNGTASGSFAAQGSVSIPSGDGGSGGCEMIASASGAGSPAALVIAAALALCAMAWRKRTETSIR